MDIDLLSRMVKELILDHNIVGLPGLGSFVAEEIPSTFSDRGYTINPPYRLLSFHAGRGEDGLLAGLYSWSNGVPYSDAEVILRHFISELREVLEDRKLVVLPGLGKLRATKDNNFFFVGDEDLDIFPDGFGLQPLSLKTHQGEPRENVIPLMTPVEPILAPETPEAVPAEPDAAPAELDTTAEETAAADAAEDTVAAEDEEDAPAPETGEIAEAEAAEVESAPETEETAAPEPASEAEPAQEPEPEPLVIEPVEEPASSQEAAAKKQPAETPVRKKSGFWQFLLILLAVLLVAFIAFMILSRTAPGLIDKLLYTPEELSIINYQL